MTKQEYIVEVFKGGILFRGLLSQFEQTFIDDEIARYRMVREKMQIRGGQGSIYQQIGEKLNLKLGAWDSSWNHA